MKALFLVNGVVSDQVELASAQKELTLHFEHHHPDEEGRCYFRKMFFELVAEKNGVAYYAPQGTEVRS